MSSPGLPEPVSHTLCASHASSPIGWPPALYSGSEAFSHVSKSKLKAMLIVAPAHQRRRRERCDPATKGHLRSCVPFHSGQVLFARLLLALLEECNPDPQQ